MRAMPHHFLNLKEFQTGDTAPYYCCFPNYMMRTVNENVNQLI